MKVLAINSSPKMGKSNRALILNPFIERSYCVKHTLNLGIAAVLMAALGCGPKVMVPPRIDLKQHEVVGIIEFRSSAEGELGSHATRKFTEAVRRDQGMVRIVQLGSEAEVLKAVGRDRLDQAAFKVLGDRHEVSTIITGELVVSDVRPDITITPGFGYMSFAAEDISPAGSGLGLLCQRGRVILWVQRRPSDLRPRHDHACSPSESSSP